MVRHGQSLANAARRFAGHSDFDLSDLGHKQAAKVAEYLIKNEKIDLIYSSDLLRAYHTATPISEAFGIPVQKDEGLREIFAGQWEALTLEEIAKKYAEDFSVWKNNYSQARPTGGESTTEVYERVIPHVIELAARHDGKTILLATHATVTRAFIAYSKGLGPNETELLQGFPQNASLNIFIYDNGRVSGEKINFTDHLTGLELPPDPHA